jgi:phosphoglycolate phosphatase-like HAD superfamily hydrolase
VKTVAVDFDKVVHGYSRGWQDGTIYDPPMPGAYEALLQLSMAGWRLVLHTTRVRDAEQVQPLLDWLETNGFGDMFAEVTDRKPLAVAYIDDRAIHFENWPQALEELKSRE